MPKERLEKLAEILLKYSTLDFSEKARVSEAADETDAIAAGLNVLAEELQAHIEKEKKLTKQLIQLNFQLEKKVAERTADLAKSEKLFRSLIEHSNDGMGMLNEKGEVVYVTRSAEKIDGHPVEDLIGKVGLGQVHPDDREHAMKIIEEAYKSPGKPIYSQHRILHKNGTWVWTEGTMTNFLNDPDIRALVVNFRNISERKKSEEEQKEAIRALEEMMFITSHRVRQPVVNILGLANLLDEGAGEEEHEKLLSYIKQAAVSLDDFTKELTAFIHKQELKAKVHA